MASVDLTVSQQSLLTTLVNLYREQQTVVTGEDVASEVDRAPGTVRNRMQLLKSLNLVEAVSGPKGGHKPTTAAYEAFGIDRIEQSVTVPVRRNDDLIDGVNVETIKLTNIDHPERCRAEIRVLGSLHDVHHGDEMEIGPTSLTKLVIDGSVEGTNHMNRLVVLQIQGMRTEETLE